jgi:hypothetical protein
MIANLNRISRLISVFFGSGGLRSKITGPTHPIHWRNGSEFDDLDTERRRGHQHASISAACLRRNLIYRRRSRCRSISSRDGSGRALLALGEPLALGEGVLPFELDNGLGALIDIDSDLVAAARQLARYGISLAADFYKTRIDPQRISVHRTANSGQVEGPTLYAQCLRSMTGEREKFYHLSFLPVV